MGLRPGRVHAAFAGGGEFFGGVALALGLLLPFAAAIAIAVMVAAILKVHLRNGFFVTNGGFEYNLVLIVTFFALAGVGGGSWSLDAALGLDLTGAGWALAALAVGIAGGAGAVFFGSRHGARHRRHGGSPSAHPGLRQPQGEHGPAVGSVGGLGRAPVRLGHLPDDREAEA